MITPLVLAAVPQILKAENAHCTGQYTISDNNPSTVAYYLVSFRVETSAGWIQSPSTVIPSVNQPNTYTIPITDIDVPYPNPMPANYYRIRVIIVRIDNDPNIAPVQHNNAGVWTNLDNNYNLDGGTIEVKF